MKKGELGREQCASEGPVGRSLALCNAKRKVRATEPCSPWGISGVLMAIGIRWLIDDRDAERLMSFVRNFRGRLVLRGI